MSIKLVIVATSGLSTNVIYNSLNEKFDILSVLIEEPISKKRLLKGRLKKLGIITVFGQLIFQMIIVPVLKYFSKKRIKEILKNANLSNKEIPLNKIERIPSVNDELFLNKINKLKPDIILVNGTRIISGNIISKVDTPMVNMHAGITPFYRGVHGGYWSLVQNDLNNFGVTIHFIDSGIDTGEVIDSITTLPDKKKDNFTTYPVVQLSVGVPKLVEVIQSIASKSYTLKKNSIKGNLWYHPTIWSYCYYNFFKGVK